MQESQPRYSQGGIKSCLTYIAQRIPENFERGISLAFDSEERRKLRGDDLDRRTRDESTDCWSWDELDQPAEPQSSEEKNYDTLER